jgi:serine/threonine-protein kinase
VGGLFQAQEPWNTPVDQAQLDPSSDTIIQWLADNGGWGNGNVFQIDLSLNIQYAGPTTPMVTFVQPGGPCTPDCDPVTTFPVPPGGAVEGNTGYACEGGGDCHLLVVDQANNKLYEMWEAFSPPDPNVFNTGSGAFIWDLTKAYPPSLRGDGCTSADAGGFPIAAMLFTADEVYAKQISHAIRFILPNARIRGGGVYVHPGTHTTGATSGGSDAPPYGVRLRLRADFPLDSLPSAGAQVVARAMQKYGLFLADGGNIALTAANDAFTTHAWTDVDVDSHSLNGIQVTDMEVVDMGTPVADNGCVRNP